MVEIFGTLGPACSSVDVLEKMFLEGMTGMRLNMSHSGLKESEELIRNFHQAAKKAGVMPELLIDMQGPEVRVGRLSKSLQLSEQEEVRLTGLENGGEDEAVIPVPDHVCAAVDVGDEILLDDGRMELQVLCVKPQVTARVVRGGILQSRKSLKVKDKDLTGPVITKQDKENIRLMKEYGVTALMQPFVTRGAELLEIREELSKNAIDQVRIFAKIENCRGMKNINDIIPEADMVVIARGDLGNDMPLWELPVAQKNLACACTKAAKPFLVVTQMLASMVENPVPTRAEVSDIFHAVVDGADAVMVTNETAVGKYPVEVIRYLKRTVEEAIKWKGL